MWVAGIATRGYIQSKMHAHRLGPAKNITFKLRYTSISTFLAKIIIQLSYIPVKDFREHRCK